jgi:hypothetical protein
MRTDRRSDFNRHSIRLRAFLKTLNHRSSSRNSNQVSSEINSSTLTWHRDAENRHTYLWTVRPSFTVICTELEYLQCSFLGAFTTSSKTAPVSLYLSVYSVNGFSLNLIGENLLMLVDTFLFCLISDTRRSALNIYRREKYFRLILQRKINRVLCSIYFLCKPDLRFSK